MLTTASVAWAFKSKLRAVCSQRESSRSNWMRPSVNSREALRKSTSSTRTWSKPSSISWTSNTTTSLRRSLPKRRRSTGKSIPFSTAWPRCRTRLTPTSSRSLNLSFRDLWRVRVTLRTRCSTRWRTSGMQLLKRHKINRRVSARLCYFKTLRLVRRSSLSWTPRTPCARRCQ